LHLTHLDDADSNKHPIANLSERIRHYLRDLGLPNPDKSTETVYLVWHHVQAVGFSPGYLAENADGIRQDWPRIPLPSSKKTLMESAALGKRIAELLDTERRVPGVTNRKIVPEFIEVGAITRAGGGSLNPDDGHLELTAGWGHAGKDGIIMPGKGRVEVRTVGAAEPGSIEHETWPRAFSVEAYDVYLNDVAYWANIPAPVWKYTIGGYQVIKKWLSYREKSVLGRGLTMEEVQYVTEMARRIAALVLLQEKLDANYQGVNADTWDWTAE